MRTNTILLFIITCLPSCSIRPVIRSNGDAYLGGDFLHKTDGLSIAVTKLDGTTINYSSTTEDGTAVAKAGITAYTTISGVRSLSSLYKSKEVTARNAANQKTAQVAAKEVTKQQAAQEVTKQKALEVIPPETAVTPTQ